MLENDHLTRWYLIPLIGFEIKSVVKSNCMVFEGHMYKITETKDSAVPINK